VPKPETKSVTNFLCFRSFPHNSGREGNQSEGHVRVPFALERSVGADREDPIKIRLVIDGSVMVAYVDDLEALTCRAYDHKEGHMGLFVSDGEATFTDVEIWRR
jgi:beta-fructofuranosidase